MARGPKVQAMAPHPSLRQCAQGLPLFGSGQILSLQPNSRITTMTCAPSHRGAFACPHPRSTIAQQDRPTAGAVLTPPSALPGVAQGMVGGRKRFQPEAGSATGGAKGVRRGQNHQDLHVVPYLVPSGVVGPTRTTRLPKFSPRRRPMNALGAASRPSIISSRY